MDRKVDASSYFKALDATSYDSVSEAFDRFTEVYSTPIASRIVELAAIEGAQQVIDVGTGTGVVALEAARRLQSPSGVSGIDLSEGMLQVAR